MFFVLKWSNLKIKPTRVLLQAPRAQHWRNLVNLCSLGVVILPPKRHKGVENGGTCNIAGLLDLLSLLLKPWNLATFYTVARCLALWLKPASVASHSIESLLGGGESLAGRVQIVGRRVGAEVVPEKWFKDAALPEVERQLLISDVFKGLWIRLENPINIRYFDCNISWHNFDIETN